MNNIIKRVWNQNRMVNIEDLSGMAFQAEDGGHTFEISGVNDAGETVELSGTVSGVFMRPDLADIAIVGSATDGVASVTLPADCYAVNGRFALTIFVTSDSQKVAVYAAVGTVTRTSGGAVAGDTPQDVVDLINAINAAVATIPADYTDLMAAIAPTYSNTALYAVGAYAWYDGVLYRCTTAITTAESWTAAHWTAAVLGDDVADLKSALNKSGSVWNVPIKLGKYYNGTLDATLATTDNVNSVYTDVIDVSSVIGGKIKMQITSMGSGSRYTGFCDSDNKIKERYVAPDSTLWTLNPSTGMYEAELEIKYPKFYYSNSASVAKTIIVISNIDKNASDIKELQKSNVDTKNSISGIEKYIATGVGSAPVEYSWKQGYVHELNYYAPSSSANTIYSDLLDTKPFPLKISVTSGYKICVVSYNADGSFVRNTGWLTGDDNIETITTAKYCIEARKTDNSNLTPSVGNVTSVSWIVQGGAGAIYVSPTGSDSNNGLTRSAPFKTIQKAVNSGAKTILVKEGTYKETVTLTDLIDVSIRLDPYYSAFAAGTDEDNPKIVIDGEATRDKGIVITRCTNCSFADIEIKNCNTNGFRIDKSTGLRFDDCVVHDIGTISPSGVVGGFVITYTDADYYNCVAFNIGATSAGTGEHLWDGFNIHGTGTTNFVNCSGWNCEDDGISHHDACCGLIDGGEWYNCGKGGISSPTHGAKINVQNVYSHHNKFGLYAGNDSAVTDRGNILVSNCVFKNNSLDDLYANSYYKIIAMNCILDTHSGQNITLFNQQVH